MSRAILIVGHSHIGAIRAAAKTRRERDPAAPRTRVIHMGEARYAPPLVAEDGGIRFGPALAAEIDEQIVRHDPLVASVIGGNAHNVLGLMQHPRPFDFMLSDGSDGGAPLDPAAEPIAERFVRAALEQAMADDLACLRLLAERAPALVHLQSPPPIADGNAIAAMADAFFSAQGLTPQSVAPRALRRRIWLLASRIVREACAGLGIGYLPVPPELLDADGFLAPAFVGDATHGNEAYGEAWIAMLERR